MPSTFYLASPKWLTPGPKNLRALGGNRNERAGRREQLGSVNENVGQVYPFPSQTDEARRAKYISRILKLLEHFFSILHFLLYVRRMW